MDDHPTDGAGNAPATPFNGTAPTVDNAAPVTTQIAATNAGGTANRPDLGDQVVFTTGKTGATGTADLLDPYTILPNWSGETTVQGVIDGNASPESFTFRDLTTPTANVTAIGSVENVTNNYLSANRTYGASSTRSTIAVRPTRSR